VSHGPLGFWFQGCDPKAGKAIAIRDKVDAVFIRRPARFVVSVLALDDTNQSLSLKEYQRMERGRSTPPGEWRIRPSKAQR
jgi:hypothetical protein